MAAMAVRAIWKRSISFAATVDYCFNTVGNSYIYHHDTRCQNATLCILVNWTDQGIRTAKDAPKRVEDFKNAVERSEGKMVDGYYTMGQYDFVITVELPNDETAMSLMLATGIRGNVRTATLKAFSISEAEKIITKLS